jgi:hydroxyacylglutathione hydrolase
MNLVALPAFDDNPIRMLHNRREAMVVDPAESARVTPSPGAHGVELAGILVMRQYGTAVLAAPRPWKIHLR